MVRSARVALLAAFALGSVPVQAQAQSADSGCPGLMPHPVVQEGAATVTRGLVPAGGDSTGRSAEQTFFAFRNALARELRDSDLIDRYIDGRDMPHQDVFALMKTAGFVSDQLTAQIALRCFPTFRPIYEAAAQAEAQARSEQEAMEREARANAETQRRAEQEEYEARRQRQIADMEAEQRRQQERLQADRDTANRVEQLRQGRRQIERQEEQRQAEEAAKPHNRLRQVFGLYAYIKRCHEEREGYAEIYVSDAELNRARGAAKTLQDQLMTAAVDIDTRSAWSDGVRLTSAKPTNRQRCQLALRDLGGAARDVTPADKVLEKDF